MCSSDLNAAIAQEGAPRDLYEEPANLFVADFIGDANLVGGELAELQGDRARVNLVGVELQLRHRGARPGPIRVAIRPESLILAGQQPAQPSINGRIAKAAYLGTHMEYTVSSALGELFVVDRRVTQPYAVDAPVWISLAEHGVTVIPS